LNTQIHNFIFDFLKSVNDKLKRTLSFYLTYALRIGNIGLQVSHIHYMVFYKKESLFVFFIIYSNDDQFTQNVYQL